MSFKDFLKNAREKAGLGINELSRASGVSAPYLSRLEKGERRPPMPDVLKKLAPHLKVDYHDIWWLPFDWRLQFDIFLSLVDGDFHENTPSKFSVLLPKVYAGGVGDMSWCQK